MADLKAIGSEKLTGDAKIRRIMEIARYGETPKNKEYHNSTVSFTKKAPNGVTYAIVQEKDGYYVKSGINESKLDYVDGIHNKRKNRFRSYSSALKRVNLILKPINEEFNNGKATSLFEQCAAVIDTSDMGDDTGNEEMAYYDNNNDMTAEMFEQEDEEEKFVLKVDEPADDMGGEEMDLDMEDDMDDEDMDMEDDMEDEDMDMEDEELDVDMEDEEEMTGFMKPIQKLTGKLGQKLRDVEEELGSEDIKYVLNSIISAVDLDNLDEEDLEDILDRFEEDDLEYGMEDDIDIEGGDEEFDMEDEDMDMEDEDMDMDMEDEEIELSEQKIKIGKNKTLDLNLQDIPKALLRTLTGLQWNRFAFRSKLKWKPFGRLFSLLRRRKSICSGFESCWPKMSKRQRRKLEKLAAENNVSAANKEIENALPDEDLKADTPAPSPSSTPSTPSVATGDVMEAKIAKTLKKYFKASKEEKVLHERKIKKFIKGKLTETKLKKSVTPHTIEQELLVSKLIKEGRINKFRGESKGGVMYFEDRNRRPIGVTKNGKLVR